MPPDDDTCAPVVKFGMSIPLVAAIVPVVPLRDPRAPAEDQSVERGE
jgi:hypothetical protein